MQPRVSYWIHGSIHVSHLREDTPCEISRRTKKCSEFPTSSSSKHRMTCTMASDVLLWKGCECSIYKGAGRLVQVSPRKYATRVCFQRQSFHNHSHHPTAGSTYVADVAQKLVSKALSFGSTPANHKTRAGDSTSEV